MVGDILLTIINWVLHLLLIILPTDVGNNFNRFSSILNSLAEDINNFLAFISVYVDLQLLLIMIVLMVLTPTIFFTIRFINSYIAKRIG